MQTTVARYASKFLPRAGSSSRSRSEINGVFSGLVFLGRDPAMADENLYRYCENGPTNATDPRGLAVLEYEVDTLLSHTPVPEKKDREYEEVINKMLTAVNSLTDEQFNKLDANGCVMFKRFTGQQSATNFGGWYNVWPANGGTRKMYIDWLNHEKQTKIVEQTSGAMGELRKQAVAWANNAWDGDVLGVVAHNAGGLLGGPRHDAELNGDIVSDDAINQAMGRIAGNTKGKVVLVICHNNPNSFLEGGVILWYPPFIETDGGKVTTLVFYAATFRKSYYDNPNKPQQEHAVPPSENFVSPL